jgi:predicted ATP-grasp superfamily ATP-dependent carboligase
VHANRINPKVQDQVLPGFAVNMRRMAKPMANIENIVARVRRRSSRPVAVLVNTGDANSYGMVANLGSAGVSVISVSSDPDNLTFHSRYVQGVICPDFVSAEAAFVGFLLELGQRISPKPVLFANGDEISLVLLRNRESLQVCYHLPFAPYDLALQLTDKVAFYRLLEEHQIPHARTYLPQTSEEVEALAEKVTFPCIIKPSQSQTFSSIFGNKCLRVDSPEQLLELYAKVAKLEPQVIVQDLLQGTERYLVYNYVSQSGEHKAISVYRKERIFPIDFGNATACRSIVDTDLEEQATHLLKALNYTGLGEAEFQRDARDGQLKVVEINIRSTTQSRLSAACGVNMEYIAYRDLLGEQQDFVANRRAGVLWVDLYRDMLAVFSDEGYRNITGLTISRWIGSMRGQRVFAFCSLRDPKPGLMVMMRVTKLHLSNLKVLARTMTLLSSLTRRG